MDLLARRDHSRKQLQQKLASRGFGLEEVETVLDGLQHDRLLDDERYAEAYIRHRVERGYGPLRIRHELLELGIESEPISRLMASYSEQWPEVMRQQRCKKFGESLPEDQRARMKQARFLQNRGFSPESVMRLFRR